MKFEHLLELLAPLYVPIGACRAMQLIMVDKLFAPVRAAWDWVFNREHLKIGDPDLSYMGYLIQCPWCTSMWVGLAIIVGLVNTATRHATLWLMVAFTISLLAVVYDRLIDQYASDEDAALRDQTAPAPPPVVVVQTPPPAAVAAAFDAVRGPDSPPGS